MLTNSHYIVFFDTNSVLEICIFKRIKLMCQFNKRMYTLINSSTILKNLSGFESEQSYSFSIRIIQYNS